MARPRSGASLREEQPAWAGFRALKQLVAQQRRECELRQDYQGAAVAQARLEELGAEEELWRREQLEAEAELRTAAARSRAESQQERERQELDQRWRDKLRSFDARARRKQDALAARQGVEREARLATTRRVLQARQDNRAAKLDQRALSKFREAARMEQAGLGAEAGAVRLQGRQLAAERDRVRAAPAGGAAAAERLEALQAGELVDALRRHKELRDHILAAWQADEERLLERHRLALAACLAPQPQPAALPTPAGAPPPPPDEAPQQPRPAARHGSAADLGASADALRAEALLALGASAAGFGAAAPGRPPLRRSGSEQPRRSAASPEPPRSPAAAAARGARAAPAAPARPGTAPASAAPAPSRPATAPHAAGERGEAAGRAAARRPGTAPRAVGKQARVPPRKSPGLWRPAVGLAGCRGQVVRI